MMKDHLTIQLVVKGFCLKIIMTSQVIPHDYRGTPFGGKVNRATYLARKLIQILSPFAQTLGYRRLLSLPRLTASEGAKADFFRND
jgi:retron-type reverse transcriptase